MSRTKRIALTLLTALAALCLIAGWAVCWQVVPLGSLLWIGLMTGTGYVAVNAVAGVWGFGDDGLELDAE